MKHLTSLAVITGLLIFQGCTSTEPGNNKNNNDFTAQSLKFASPSPTPNLNDNSPSGLLSQAQAYLNGTRSDYDYDISEAKKRLAMIPKSAPEYKEAQRLIAQIKTRPKTTIAPTPVFEQEKPVEKFPDILVREKLKRDYPDDYITQKCVYDMQVEAYEYMKTLPSSKIKSKVQRDYPHDYVTQKGVYDMQIEARSAMEKP